MNNKDYSKILNKVINIENGKRTVWERVSVLMLVEDILYKDMITTLRYVLDMNKVAYKIDDNLYTLLILLPKELYTIPKEIVASYGTFVFLGTKKLSLMDIDFRLYSIKTLIPHVQYFIDYLLTVEVSVTPGGTSIVKKENISLDALYDIVSELNC